MLAELATRPAVTTPQTATVAEAARQMLEREIGFLVVVDGERRPTGALTDGDIVVRAVALGRAGDTAVAEVMSVTRRRSVWTIPWPTRRGSGPTGSTAAWW